MPAAVQKALGNALRDLQFGAWPATAKGLAGLGSGVLEIIDDFDGDTYRAAVTIEFHDAVYVLHVFQKKSKRGIATPRQDMERIRIRLKFVRRFHQERANG
jgi:phage-related protein